MDLRFLCTKCMQGTIRNGICSSCGKNAGEHEDRPNVALPERYRLGRYMLGRVIGHGGFGITYLAWDMTKNRRTAVKELYPCQDVRRNEKNGSVTPLKGQEIYFAKCRQRFREEANLLHSMRSEPSVLNVYSLIEANNTVYYSMEYLDGCNLKSFIAKNGRLEWQRLSPYVKDILYSLRFLHARGLIHRDISPDNIFLLSGTHAKLIDFGSVRRVNNENGFTVILKQSFAPPEQYYTNGRQGPWTDIYALSVTIYYALTGVLVPAAPERAGGKPTVPLRKLCPYIPQCVADTVEHGMSLMLYDRYASVSDMASALFPGENIDSFRRVGKTADTAEKEKPHKGTASGSAHGTDYGRMAIRSVAGIYAGKVFVLGRGGKISFGRDKSCTVSYPSDLQGVSRRQCSMAQDLYGSIYVRDDNSRNGTFLSGKRLKPGVWEKAGRGSTVSFLTERYYIE